MDGEKTGIMDILPICLGVVLISFVILRVAVVDSPPRPLLSVGDIVEFDAARHFQPAAGGVLEAANEGGHDKSCTLEAGAIHRSGASMVVTRVDADLSRYGIRWVSGGPSSDRADCGRDAFLTVGPATLMGLYSTADRANGQLIAHDMNPSGDPSVTLPPPLP